MNMFCLKKFLTLLKKQRMKKNKNIISHNSILKSLPNFKSFPLHELVRNDNPVQKTYKCFNTNTEKMDEINFPDYKKWYKENKAVWNLADYGFAQFKLEYLDEKNVRRTIKRRQDTSADKKKINNFRENGQSLYKKWR